MPYQTKTLLSCLLNICAAYLPNYSLGMIRRNNVHVTLGEVVADAYFNSTLYQHYNWPRTNSILLSDSCTGNIEQPESL